MSVPDYSPVVFTEPSRYTIDDYRRDIAMPSPSLKARAVDAGVDLICTIHKNTPAAWLVDQIANDGKIAPEHLFLDDLCRPRNQLPPDPVPPFSGGQCDVVLYEVQVLVKYKTGEGNPTQVVDREVTVTDRVWGAITSVYMSDPGTVVIGDTSVPGYQRVQIACRGGGTESAKPPTAFSPYGSSVPNLQSASIVSATRVDSQPDSCGDPPKRYPPVLPSPDDLTRTTPFQITPTLNAPITVTVKPVVNFSPTVFAPVALVNVGGIDIQVDLGGFTLSPTFNYINNNNYPSTNPSTPPANSVPVKEPSKHLADDIDILEIINRLDRIGRELEECCERDRPYPPPDANKVVTTVLGTANSGLFDLPKDTFQVTVSTLEHDIPIKMQAGDQSPTVLYSGWAWFGAANNMSERMPVDSQYKIYSPSRYISNTFGFKLHVGLTAIIKAYSIKPKPVEP